MGKKTVLHSPRKFWFCLEQKIFCPCRWHGHLCSYHETSSFVINLTILQHCWSLEHICSTFEHFKIVWDFITFSVNSVINWTICVQVTFSVNNCHKSEHFCEKSNDYCCTSFKFTLHLHSQGRSQSGKTHMFDNLEFQLRKNIIHIHKTKKIEESLGKSILFFLFLYTSYIKLIINYLCIGINLFKRRFQVEKHLLASKIVNELFLDLVAATSGLWRPLIAVVEPNESAKFDEKTALTLWGCDFLCNTICRRR